MIAILKNSSALSYFITLVPQLTSVADRYSKWKEFLDSESIKGSADRAAAAARDVFDHDGSGNDSEFRATQECTVYPADLCPEEICRVHWIGDTPYCLPKKRTPHATRDETAMNVGPDGVSVEKEHVSTRGADGGGNDDGPGASSGDDEEPDDNTRQQHADARMGQAPGFDPVA